MASLDPLATRVILAFALAVSGGACGRTEIDLLDPCGPGDTTRACNDVCGVGSQTCANGFWQPCVVPPTERACSGICGDGVQQCVDKKWAACQIPVATRACSSICGGGTETCMNETWTACNAPQPRPPTLHAVVRDFHSTHPDFDLHPTAEIVDLSIVEPDLGADNKPVYAGNPTTPTTSGVASFNQWYNDVPGQNETTTLDLPLMATTDNPDFYVYSNLAFFPIDNQLFGNEGLPHNYQFTLEAHTHFQYTAGETFYFAGDDDVWVFINRRLAINLGGIHSTLSDTVDLDASASMLGMTPGQSYQLDIFFAERHPTGSTFTVRTSIADASSCE